MKNKAQIAMETIMVYGAAILVVTLAIGALMYFGVLDMSGLLPDKCSLSGNVVCENFQVVSVVDATGVVTSSQIQLELRNRVGKNLDGIGLKITGIDDWDNIDCGGEVKQTDIINNGDSVLITVPCGSVTKLPVGKKYKAKLDLTYSIVNSKLDQKIVGELQAKIAE